MRTLKNIEEPVRVYALSASRPTLAQTHRTKEALPLPDKPSIAVLPFDNLSGDHEQEYFADGIVEEIITALSRFAVCSSSPGTPASPTRVGQST